MTQIYIEYNFNVIPRNPGTEILIAELAEVGFESFDEHENGVSAYIQKEAVQQDLLNSVQILNSSEFQISFDKKEIEQQDWNQVWESNFQPIEINNQCRIRASFHPAKNLDYEIIINPKMAFGTGHHATTHLMVLSLLEADLTDKKVLDMGCGTGVLAILASMRGANPVTAIDIDPWSYENSKENAKLNLIENIDIREGDAKLLKNQTFEVIFANINRNILLNDMPAYAQCLAKNNHLFMSGFYTEDLPIIKNRAAELGLKYINHKTRDNWVAAQFIKL